MTDLVGPPGGGLTVFRDHFARFRPLITATALGTAAGVHTAVTGALTARVRISVPRVRDNALITLGKTHAAITAALPGTLATRYGSRTPAIGGPDLWACVGKAHEVEVAVRAVDELVQMVGAAGFTASSPLTKARADLDALRYADGIHDSLYRSGGRTLLTAEHEPVTTVTALPASVKQHATLPATA